MTAETMLNSETDDAALVVQCLTGNRDAFGWIVRRYQSLVCALAYNATGSLSQSEDLAQETFVAAWRQLSALRDPAKLRPWLCQIVRNMAYDALKKQGREPSDRAESLEAAGESHITEDSPTDHAISREEEAILWRSIEDIPAPYREPLILFYRQHQSIQRVAEALDLTEDAVKQRLSRGRKLLREQVLAFIEGALGRTNPTPAFAQNVLLALPATTTATTASAASTVLKAGAAKSLATGLGALSLIALGNYASYRAALVMASSDREKNLIKRFYGRLLAAVIALNVVLALFIFWGIRSGKDHPALFAWSLVAFAFVSILGFTAIGLRLRTQYRQFAAPPPATVWEYRSQIEFIGLPLVHIRIGGPHRAVKAWIAAGGFAVGGLFAFGGLAIAPICVGGMAIGLLAWGGMAIGLIAIGGVTLGGWVIGGMAVAWESCGACAIAWKAAVGEVALAHGFAIGRIVLATQAGTAAAEDYVKSSAFFQSAEWLGRFSVLLNLLWVLPLGLWWRAAARAKHQKAAALLAVALFVALGHFTRGGFLL
ncbi:MAG TPA: sigma-70 family RNA polymerase sigma factor [Verrucomicrobiae bacterium]